MVAVTALGLRRLLTALPDDAGHGPRERPDAAIVDIRMPPAHTGEGLAAAQQIRAEHPGVSG